MARIKATEMNFLKFRMILVSGSWPDVLKAKCKLRKGRAPQQPPEAAGGGLRAAVPEAGRDGGRGGRDGGEERAGQQGEFREALAGLGRMDELAGGAEHLLGGER